MLEVEDWGDEGRRYEVGDSTFSIGKRPEKSHRFAKS